MFDSPPPDTALQAASAETLAENRRLDLLPSAVYASRRIKQPVSVTFIFDGVAFQSLTSAFDLWVPILQAIQVNKAKIIFEIYEDKGGACKNVLEKLIKDLNECFGIKDVNLSEYKIKSPAKQEVFIANNPGWVELDVLAAEGISGVLGGVALPAGKKMLDGISCCTRACCGLFFRRRAERQADKMPLLTSKPLSST